MIPKIIKLVILCLLIYSTSCTYDYVKPKVAITVDTSKNPIPLVSFANYVQPIFTKSCITCHKANGYGKYDFTVNHALSTLTTNSLISTSSPSNSILITYLNSGHKAAPIPGGIPSTAKIDSIQLWISQGALNN